MYLLLLLMNLYLYLQHASVGRGRESELSVSVSVSVSINKSAADCSGFSLEMVKRWSNMLLNRNCCCRSLFIIGIETRLVSLCFLLSTSFYRKRRWGERQCGGGGVGIVVAGARTCQADSFLYACVIYYPKKKKPKTCLGFLKTPPLLSSDRQFITLAAFRKRTSSISGQPFCLYKLRVWVCETGERSKNKPRMKMNYARLQFFFIFWATPTAISLSHYADYINNKLEQAWP